MKRMSVLLGAGLALALVGCRDRSALESSSTRTVDAPAEVVSSPQPAPTPAEPIAPPSDLPGTPATGGSGMEASSDGTSTATGTGTSAGTGTSTGDTTSHVTDTTVHNNSPPASEGLMPSEQGLGGSGQPSAIENKPPPKDGGTGGSGLPIPPPTTQPEPSSITPSTDKREPGTGYDGLGTERP
jgi:hypothetical protein